MVRLNIEQDNVENEPEMKTSEISQVTLLAEERLKRHDFAPETVVTTIPLGDFTEQTRNYLKDIIGGKIKSNPIAHRMENKFLSLRHTLGSEVCDNISDDDPIYRQVNYLDSLLSAIAPEVGLKTVSKLSDAIADMMRDSVDLGKFLKLLDDE